MGKRGQSQVKVVLEGGQSDVPWGFGLGWVGWKRACDPVTLFKSAVCVLYDFWEGWGEFGWKIKDIGSFQKRFLVATAKGAASWAIKEQL